MTPAIESSSRVNDWFRPEGGLSVVDLITIDVVGRSAPISTGDREPGCSQWVS